MAFAVTSGSRWAGSMTPVPNRIVEVTDAAAARAMSGSTDRLYSSASSASPVGGGVRRDVGMWVCSGIHTESNPRSSAATATSGTGIDRSVEKIVTPKRMARSLLSGSRGTLPSCPESDDVSDFLIPAAERGQRGLTWASVTDEWSS